METSTESENCGAISSASETRCIFCASSCPALYSVVDGKIVKIKQEIETSNGTEDDPPELQEQLRAVFILKYILDVKLAECANFFKEYEGQFPPYFWVSICHDCRPIFHAYFFDLKGTEKCEVSQNYLKSMVKLMIQRSSDEIAPEYDDEDERIRYDIWRTIREKALNGFSEENAVELLNTNTSYWKKKPRVAKLLEKHRVKYRVVVKYEESEDESETSVIPSQIKYDDSDSDESGSESDSDESGSESDSDESSSESDSDESGNESDSSDPKGKSLPRNPKYDFVFFKCEKCGALMKGHQERIDRHNELHKPGRSQKKCETCGWVVGCVKRHSTDWHSEKAPDLSAKKVSIRPLSMWKKRSEINLLESNLSHPNYVACSDEGYRYECRHCSGYRFWKREQAVKHSQMHDEGKGVICSICGWLINPNKSEYHNTRRHSEKSSNIIEKSVPEEKKVPNINRKLKTGRESLKPFVITGMSHSTQRQKCEHCLLDFKTKWLLWSHQEESHKLDPRGTNSANLAPKVGLCEVCGIALRSARGIHAHKKLHVQEIKCRSK